MFFKMGVLKFRNIHRKTPVLESLFKNSFFIQQLWRLLLTTPWQFEKYKYGENESYGDIQS